MRSECGGIITEYPKLNKNEKYPIIYNITAVILYIATTMAAAASTTTNNTTDTTDTICVIRNNDISEITPPNKGMPFTFRRGFTIQGVLDDKPCSCYECWMDESAVLKYNMCGATQFNHDCVCMLFAAAGFYEWGIATRGVKYITRLCLASNHRCLCNMQHYADTHLVALWHELPSGKIPQLHKPDMNTLSCLSTTHTNYLDKREIWCKYMGITKTKKLKIILIWLMEQKQQMLLPNELIKYIAKLSSLQEYPQRQLRQ